MITFTLFLIAFVLFVRSQEQNLPPSFKTSNEFIEKLETNTLLSFIAYCSPKDIENFECYWCNRSFITPKILSVHYYQEYFSLYFTAIYDRTLYVIFRGTPNPSKSIMPWVRDFDFVQIPLEYAPEGVKVHKGFHTFYSAFNETLMNEVSTLLDEHRYNIDSMEIIGHSMGTTQSPFFLHFFSRKKNEVFEKLRKEGKIYVYSYGAPRVGNDVFVSYMNTIIPKDNFFRIINQRDIVTSLPPEFTEYRHVPFEYWFQSDELDSWKRCDGSGEDPKCSDSVTKWSIPNHVKYLGFSLMDASFDPCYCW